MKEIKNAVKEFKKIREKLTLVENVLNTAVEMILKSNPTVEDLEDLIDTLPKEYPGTRRVLEALIRKNYKGEPLKR